jgi:hypothetical protein
MAPRIVKQKNMVVGPVGLGTKNCCAGEGQQHFTQPDPRMTELAA